MWLVFSCQSQISVYVLFVELMWCRNFEFPFLIRYSFVRGKLFAYYIGLGVQRHAYPHAIINTEANDDCFVN